MQDTHFLRLPQPKVAPVVLPASRQHHFRSTALGTATSAEPPQPSHGSADSGSWSARPSSVLPNFQRLLHRRASYRPAVGFQPPARLCLFFNLGYFSNTQSSIRSSTSSYVASVMSPSLRAQYIKSFTLERVSALTANVAVSFRFGFSL